MNIINNCDELFRIYGEKVKNFNGRWEDNPAKLGVLHWFSQNEKYDFMWVFEKYILCIGGHGNSPREVIGPTQERSVILYTYLLKIQ